MYLKIQWIIKFNLASPLNRVFAEFIEFISQKKRDKTNLLHPARSIVVLA